MTLPSHNRSRRAFTLVELLVVAAIIGALVALLLPAVQAGRESARRTQCASQVKQLVLAVLSYESTHKLLPSCGRAEVRKDVSNDAVMIFNPYGGLQLSWIVDVLPRLEAAALAGRFDRSKGAGQQVTNPQAVALPALVCPSDGAGGAPYIHPYSPAPAKSFAKGNYAAYTSPFHVDLQLLYRGAFIADGQPLAAIEDGTSNTLALAEIRTLDRDDDSRGAWALSWPGATLLAFDMHPTGWSDGHGQTSDGAYAAAMNAPYEANPSSAGATQTPNCQGPNRDTLSRCVAGGALYDAASAAHMPCMSTSNLPPGLRGHMSAAPRSQHPGGVNAALLDGHAAFLADEIDDFVMAYLVSVNDGRVHAAR